jgi:hypothetical protein
MAIPASPYSHDLLDKSTQGKHVFMAIAGTLLCEMNISKRGYDLCWCLLLRSFFRNNLTGTLPREWSALTSLNNL